MQMSLEEYLEFDRNSEGRFEFFEGAVYLTSGGSPEHSLLANRVGRLLGNDLDNKGCFVFQSDIKIKVPKLPPYRYADVSALCDRPVYEVLNDQKILVNPSLIVEVLSPSTERYDKDKKFKGYKSIASLTEYILISQEEPFVTLFTKHHDRFWFQSEYVTGEKLLLQSVGCEIIVNEIYEGII
ncbi:MAG: Uma2 family endonuclease [Pyrinomonadaceae bacterium]|nr:Uma2 family endonuclease [Pyrinomonadaceae bacterium]